MKEKKNKIYKKKIKQTKKKEKKKIFELEKERKKKISFGSGTREGSRQGRVGVVIKRAFFFFSFSFSRYDNLYNVEFLLNVLPKNIFFFFFFFFTTPFRKKNIYIPFFFPSSH